MCDIDGNVKAGQLPMTMQAGLYRGTVRLAGTVGFTYYPAAEGGDLVDPMLGVSGNIFPVELAVAWSLPDAPSGVTINPLDGIITIAQNAKLSVSNNITVRAVWRGETFTTILHLGKVFDGDRGNPGPQGSPAPRYRGKTITPGGVTGLVTIQVNATTPQTVQMEEGDWVAYVGVSEGIWVNGYCMRWKDLDWETVSPTDETALYMEALMDLTEGAPLGTFTAVFCRTIAAQKAFIDELQTKMIRVQNAIFGGDRFGENGVDRGNAYAGFKMDSSGVLSASNVNITGDSIFSGDIISGPLQCLSNAPIGSKMSISNGTTAKQIWGNNSIYNDASAVGNYHNKNIVGVRKSLSFDIDLESAWDGTNTNVYAIRTDYYICIVSYSNGTEEIVANFVEKYRQRYGTYETLTNSPINPTLIFTYSDPNAKTLKITGIPDYDPHNPGVFYSDKNTGALYISRG
jgi:hypothetical protein